MKIFKENIEINFVLNITIGFADDHATKLKSDLLLKIINKISYI